MARRASVSESTSIRDFIFFGGVIWALVYLWSSIDHRQVGWEGPSALIGAAAIFAWLVSFAKKRARLARFRAKYPESEVRRIIRKTIWVGETTQQLVESLGRPAGIDEMLMQTKHRQVWKYKRSGANRYRLRITVENGRVVGWDSKN